MKAILVIDMPSKCKECDLYIDYRESASDPGTQFCGWKGYVERYNPDKIPDWCPLRPMPSIKKYIQGIAKEKDMSLVGYVDGWNDCLDEIMGEQK